MKKNNSTVFIIFGAIVILSIFTVVAAINFLPNYESNSYYIKVDNDMDAKIESIDINDGKLTIKTSGSPTSYCVKSTRSKPSVNSVCWNKINNNTATISVFQYKKYYVWIKDKDNNISNYFSINSKDKK